MKFVIKVDDKWVSRPATIRKDQTLTDKKSSAAVFEEDDPELIVKEMRFYFRGSEVEYEDSDENQLLPTYGVNRCPFCEQRLESNQDIADDIFFGNPSYFVQCPNCEARGPLSDSQCEAADNWNGLYPRSRSTGIEDYGGPTLDMVIRMYHTKKSRGERTDIAITLLFEAIKTSEDLKAVLEAIDK